LLFCYTDGITEVPDKTGEMLGVRGFVTLVKGQLPPTGPGWMARVCRRVKRTCSDVSPADDVLVLSVRREATARAGVEGAE